MGFYAIANQFRGIAAIAPGFLAQVVYSSQTDESGAPYGGATRVLLSSTIVTTLLVTMVAGSAIVVLPWAMPALYGRSFVAAEIATLLLLATAIIHMSGQAGAQRLSIIKLRATGIINGLWAVLLIVFGFVLIPAAGAAGAAAAFLAAHAISNLLANFSLRRYEVLPPGYLTTILLTIVSALLLASLGYARALKPEHLVSLTLWILAIWVAEMLVVAVVGLRNGCLPRLSFRRSDRTQSIPSLSET